MKVNGEKESRKNIPSKTLSVTRSNLVGDVVELTPISRPRRCAPQTGGASVIGHTFSLMTTSVPSIQRGSGSRGSSGIPAARRRGVVDNSTVRLRQADDHGMEQQVEGERDDSKYIWERELMPSIYKRRGAATRPHAAKHGGAPTSPLIM